MARKSSLELIADGPKAARKPPPATGVEEATKGIMLRVLASEHRELRKVAADLDRPITSIVLEGLNRFLEAEGHELRITDRYASRWAERT